MQHCCKNNTKKNKCNNVAFIKYALSDVNCHDRTHANHHAHFVCEECHKTYCVEEIAVPEVEISYEFSVVSVDYTLRGICKECKI